MARKNLFPCRILSNGHAFDNQIKARTPAIMSFSSGCFHNFMTDNFVAAVRREKRAAISDPKVVQAEIFRRISQNFSPGGVYITLGGTCDAD